MRIAVACDKTGRRCGPFDHCSFFRFFMSSIPGSPERKPGSHATQRTPKSPAGLPNHLVHSGLTIMRGYPLLLGRENRSFREASSRASRFSTGLSPERRSS
jgi:hypothetical protein